MSFLSQAPPLGGLSPPHGAFQEHAAHILEWSMMLRSKGSSSTCIPEGVSTFFHTAFTAHEEERRYLSCLPAPSGFPQQNSASAPLFHPTPASVGDLLTTLQRSRDGTARKVACPPGLVRPGVILQPPRTYTPELARGRSPKPRVGYDYTTLLGKDDDRTYTGWSAADTGCAFCRKFW